MRIVDLRGARGGRSGPPREVAEGGIEPLTRRHARATAWGAVASGAVEASSKGHGRQPFGVPRGRFGDGRAGSPTVTSEPHQPTITVMRRRAASAGAGIGGTTQWSRLPSNVRSRFGRGAQSQPEPRWFHRRRGAAP